MTRNMQQGLGGSQTQCYDSLSPWNQGPPSSRHTDTNVFTNQEDPLISYPEFLTGVPLQRHELLNNGYTTELNLQLSAILHYTS